MSGDTLRCVSTRLTRRAANPPLRAGQGEWRGHARIACDVRCVPCRQQQEHAEATQGCERYRKCSHPIKSRTGPKNRRGLRPRRISWSLSPKVSKILPWANTPATSVNETTNWTAQTSHAGHLGLGARSSDRWCTGQVDINSNRRHQNHFTLWSFLGGAACSFGDPIFVIETPCRQATRTLTRKSVT